tara:strand:- start:8780 stop:9544 length:765 start_codon:yes stop_codon:yes gene_type:complete
MTEVKVPKFVGKERGLFIKRYPCHFGDFQLLSLWTNNIIIASKFNKFCRSRGYTDHWVKLDDSSYEITKVPVALLIQIINAQSDEMFKYMIGAWSIGLTQFSSSLNVIVSRTKNNAGKYLIDKVSLHYPYPIDKNTLQWQKLQVGISFRTGIFNGKDIAVNRYFLSKLRNGDVPFKLGDIIKSDTYADSIYLTETGYIPNRLNMIDDFVKNMVLYCSEMLQSSYMGTGKTVLEDEWNTFSRLLNAEFNSGKIAI